MIKLLTFKTNQTIICDLTVLDSDGVMAVNPVQVIVQPAQTGPMIGFAPFIEYCEEFKTGITFNTDDILCVTTPVRALLNEYNKMFGSGIEIVSSISKIGDMLSK